MSNLQAAYDAATDSIAEFYFTESREHDEALARPVVDATLAALNPRPVVLMGGMSGAIYPANPPEEADALMILLPLPDSD